MGGAVPNLPRKPATHRLANIEYSVGDISHVVVLQMPRSTANEWSYPRRPLSEVDETRYVVVSFRGSFKLNIFSVIRCRSVRFKIVAHGASTEGVELVPS